MKRTLLLVTAGLALAAVPARGGGLPADPFAFAVFGLEDVQIGKRAEVQRGDVGCNGDGGRVWLRGGATVKGTVAADTVRLGGKDPAGGVLCNIVENTRAGTSCNGVALPLVDASTLPIVQVSPGSDDQRLRRRASRTALPPGAYGKIRVGSHSHLPLQGGTYRVESITLSRDAEMICQAACTIGVDRRVVLNRGARFGAADAAGTGGVRVNVEAASRGRRTAFLAKAGTVVNGTVYAPDGLVRLGPNGRFTGAFVGNAVEVESRARVTALPAS